MSWDPKAYTIRVIPTPEGMYPYLAIAINLPDVNGHGQTPDEALTDLYEAISAYANELEEDGYTLTQPRQVPVEQPGPNLQAPAGSTMSTQLKGHYDVLKQTFFNGHITGQINSVYRDRHADPQKVKDFQRALANGDCTLGDKPFTKVVIQKLQILGIPVSPEMVK